MVSIAVPIDPYVLMADWLGKKWHLIVRHLRYRLQQNNILKKLKDLKCRLKDRNKPWMCRVECKAYKEHTTIGQNIGIVIKPEIGSNHRVMDGFLQLGDGFHPRVKVVSSDKDNRLKRTNRVLREETEAVEKKITEQIKQLAE